MKKRVPAIRCGVLIINLLCVLFPTLAPGEGPPDNCLSCHENASRMKQLAYSHFTVTQKEVERQTGMPAGCADCHLGNPESTDREEAHRGMGRLLLVEKKGLRAVTAERRLPLEMGSGPVPGIRYQVEKSGVIKVDSSINTILYQDKRIDTLSQDFTSMEKSCGKCHPREFAEFRKSTMGSNGAQGTTGRWVTAQ